MASVPKRRGECWLEDREELGFVLEVEEFRLYKKHRFSKTNNSFETIFVLNQSSNICSKLTFSCCVKNFSRI